MSIFEPIYAGLWDVLDLFPDDWLVTRRAGKLFLSSAIFMLLLTAFFLSSFTALHFSSWAKLSLDLVGMVGVFSSLFLWLGMLRYWIQIDGSPKWAKRLTLVVMVLGLWYGACLYFFIVYFPQVFRKARPEV